MDEAFSPIDPDELSADISFDERIKEYAQAWADADTKDRPESEIIEAGREMLVKGFPRAVTELLKIAAHGTKDDSVRASACKFVIATLMRDPAVNGDDKMDKLLREMTKDS